MFQFLKSIGNLRLNNNYLRVFLIAIPFVIAYYALTQTFSKTIFVKSKLKTSEKLGSASRTHFYELTDDTGTIYRISIELGDQVQSGSVIQVKGNYSLVHKPEVTELLPHTADLADTEQL